MKFRHSFEKERPQRIAFPINVRNVELHDVIEDQDVSLNT
jgi:hypothetical protein